MAIFRRCLEIAGMAENGGKFLGAKPKKYFIKLTQYFVALPRRYIIAEHLHTGCYSLLYLSTKFSAEKTCHSLPNVNRQTSVITTQNENT